MANGVELATAWVRIIPSMDGVQGAIATQLAPVSGMATAAGTKAGTGLKAGIGTGLKGVAGLIAGTFVIKKVTDFFADSMDAVKNWGTLNAQTGAVVKSTGGAAGIAAAQVHELANSIEGTTATEAESVQAGANMLLTFKNIRNEVGNDNDIFNQSTKALVDMSVAMGQDPKTAAIQLGKALNDPVAGISALSRVGIQFTDDQKDLIKTLVESGETMGAQKIILAELNSQFGGSGAAKAATYEGQLFLLQAAFDGLGEILVGALVPALMGMFGVITPIFTWLGENQPVLFILAAVLGIVLVAAIVAVTMAIWGMTSAMFANPALWIAVAIIALIAVIILLATNWDAVVAWITDVWGGFVGWITGVLDGFAGWWDDLWAGLFNWARDLFIGYVNWVLGLWSGFFGFMRDVGANITTWWDGLWSGLGDFVGDTFRNIANFVSGGLNMVIDLVNGAIGGINQLGKLASDVTGGAIGWKIGTIPKIPMLGGGGIVMPQTGGVLTLLAERRKPEVVLPLDRLNDYDIGGGEGRPPLVYNAAPNQSFDEEEDLWTALERRTAV